MPAHKIIDSLEAAMRFVYAHFLDEGQTLSDFMDHRRQPQANIRHITRKMLYRKYRCTYYDLVDAEQRISDRLKPNHSRIAHSIGKSKEGYESYDEGERIIKNLLAQFDDYQMEIEDPGMLARLAHYYALPRHQLAMILYIIELNGWVEDVRLEGLCREFKTMDKKFVEAKISKLNAT